MKRAYFRHQATKILGALWCIRLVKLAPPTFDPNVTQAKLEYDKIEKISFSFRSDIIF